MTNDLVTITSEDGKTVVKGVYHGAIGDLEKILNARVDIAHYEFSKVLESVLMVTRADHIQRLKDRNSPALEAIGDMQGWLEVAE